MPTPQELALAKLRSLGTLSDPIPHSALLTPEDMQGGAPLSPGGPENTPDDASLSYLYKNNLNRELQNRTFAAARTGDTNEYGALKGMLGQNTADIESDPITQATVNLEKANTAGFPSPQAQAEGERQMTLKKLLAPIQETGKNQLAVEGAKSQSDMGLLKQKQQGDMEQQDRERKMNMELMDRSQGGQGGGMSSGTFKPSFNTKGQMSLSMTPVPAQTQVKEAAARDGLSQIPNFRTIVDTLDKKGLIGPIAGRGASALVSSGFDKYLMSPESAKAFTDFKGMLSFMKSNMAIVHGGARGGSSPALAARFDELTNPNQSAAGLSGGVDAIERWLTRYGHAQSSADLDAADAELGITPAGHSPTSSDDLGPGWGG